MVTTFSATHSESGTPNLSALDDRALVVRSLANEQAAYGLLVKRHQQAVFNVCYRVLHNRQDAEDMTQECFVRGFRKLATFDQNRPFPPWIKRVAVNVCLNFKQRQPATQFSLDEERDQPAMSDAEHPAQVIERRESAETIRQVIASLPAHYAAVLELRHFQELNYAQIAQTLGLPINTAKSHLFRARKLLAAKLRDNA